MVSTLNELTLALSEGRTTAVQLTEAALARARDEAGEGARVFTKLYAESALAQARASDTLRAAGIVRSAVEGLPISIKDLFDIEGETTMAGSVAREGEPAADENAEVVQRLIAAGAVIIGRTNMTEFAYSGLGINPQLRHAAEPLRPRDRPHSGRLVLGRCRVGGRRHGRCRHRVGHRWFGAHPGRAVRPDGFQAQRLAGFHDRRAAAVGKPGFHRPPSPPACAAARSWTPSCRVTAAPCRRRSRCAACAWPCRRPWRWTPWKSTWPTASPLPWRA